jgi:hypothetical protein
MKFGKGGEVTLNEPGTLVTFKNDDEQIVVRGKTPTEVQAWIDEGGTFAADPDAVVELKEIVILVNF